MTKLISFHGDKAVKQKYVDRLKEHHRLDEIAQGIGFEKNGKIRGCAVGCTLDKYDYAAYETELGLPEWLARLEDTIFEGLPAKDAPKFAVDFLLSIPVGVNVEKIKWQFCAFLLRENIEAVSSLRIDNELKKEVIGAIGNVLKLHEDAARTGIFNKSAAERADIAVDSSVWSAAWSAADSSVWSAWSTAAYAASAAFSAAWSADRIAATSADIAAWNSICAAADAADAVFSAAWSAARIAAYDKYAKELIRLLKNSEKKNY